MGKEAEVRLSYNSLIHPGRPDITLLWPNKRFISWARETGYQGVEFLPLRGAARDILKMPVQIISSLPEIKTGHVVYNPYATLWSVVKREPDPLRPGTKLALYNIGMADPEVGKKALHRLEEAFATFPVVTYPYTQNGLRPYGEYRELWLQTHPAVFNDTSDTAYLIRLIKRGEYDGVVWDTFHALEETQWGSRPLANWRTDLARLLEVGAIREIHVQAARATEKYGKVPDLEWAKDLTGTNPNYNNELGQMIKLVKSFDVDIPFVVEISPQGLFNTGILKPSTILRTTGDLQNIHREIIDYIKRV